jgi:hypothetical protein
MEPTRVFATEEHVGRNCPYCRFPLKQGGELMVCGHCRAAHHADCWSDNGGCAVMACAGGPGKSATGEQPTTALQPDATVIRADAKSSPAQPTSVWPTAHVPQTPPRPPSTPPNGSRGSGSKGLVAALVVLALAIGGVAVALLVSQGKSNPTTVAQASRAANTTTPVVTQTTTVVTAGKTQTPAALSTTGSASTPIITDASPPPPSNSSSGGAGGSASGAKDAINTYWNDVNSGDYAGAVNMSTSSEAQTTSVGTFQSEQPHINILWTNDPVPDGAGNQVVRISFYAHNTIGNYQVCKHFVISSRMVPNGSGWLYDGHEPGTNTIAVETPGDPNCPA